MHTLLLCSHAHMHACTHADCTQAARRRQLAEAERLYRQALAGQVAELGEEHPDTLTWVADRGLRVRGRKGSWLTT